MIYLDNAATSGVKPESVYAACDHALRYCSGNPGRSGHNASLAAGKIVDDARIALAGFFGASDASEVSFTANCTQALNTAIYGVVRPGSHIITSSFEHNSVSRPVEHLKSLGCTVTVVSTDINGGVSPDDIRRALRNDTSLVVISHVSNVTGTVNDIAAVGDICAEAGVPLLVDAAQSAGMRPIDVEKMHIDMLAFPGHKGLLGPQGTGGLYIRKDLDVAPFTRGGTGSFSEMLDQPEQRPDRYESGTLNVPGIAGLAAGVTFIKDTGIEVIACREQELRKALISGLSEISGITLFSPDISCEGGCVVSFTIDGLDPSDIAMMLNLSFGIGVRAGLHCAPYTHTALGTISSGGTVRVSPGFFTADEEIDQFLDAVRDISAL